MKYKMFNRRWQLVMFTLLVGLIAGIVLPYAISPRRIRWFFDPRGSLYVSVTYINAPGEEVSGSELSQLILLKPGGELVDAVGPKKGSYKWDNLEPGWYVVKAYINDMYAGKTNEISIRSTEERWQEIVTEMAQSVIQIKVVSSDGTTPLEGAIVEVLSHRGVLWRSYPTDSDGETPEIWISRTTGENEYYDIYIYQKKDSKRSLIGNMGEVKINKPREKITVGIPPSNIVKNSE